MSDSPANLFDRVPDRIFRPLGGLDHPRRNWALLVHLYTDFFAPGADAPEGEGWTQKRVTISIERFLQRWDDQNGVGSDDQSTPMNIRANTALRYLIECEWFSLDRVGFTQYVIMRPTVQSLFELLNVFAEQGPEFIGGRVQSIRNNLIMVQKDPAENAAVFHVAAKECSALLRMLNTTRMRVREASEQLRRHEATADYLTEFFGDYISSLYIGDYADLFSRNHPLTSRWEIIETAALIVDTPESRSILRVWYRKNMRCRNDEAADLMIEGDASQVLALRDVDRMLERLKDAVTRANDQTLGYLEYKVRSQGNFDLKVDQTISAIVRAADSRPQDELNFTLGWSHGAMLDESSLKLPSNKPRKRIGAVIHQRELSPEERARRLVRQIMKGNREISDERIIEYIERHVSPGDVVTSSELHVESINDLCVLAAFSRLGLIAERTSRNTLAGVVRPQPSRNLARHIEIELTGARFENEYLEGPAVRIRRKELRSATYAN